jgi:hypothetical protein
MPATTGRLAPRGSGYTVSRARLSCRTQTPKAADQRVRQALTTCWPHAAGICPRSDPPHGARSRREGSPVRPSRWRCAGMGTTSRRVLCPPHRVHADRVASDLHVRVVFAAEPETERQVRRAHRRGPVRTVAVPGRLRHPVAAPGKLAQRGVTGRDRSSRTPDAQLTGPTCTWDGRNLEPGWMVRALGPQPGWPAHRAAGGGPCPAPGPQATDRLTGITSGRRSVSGDWSAGQGSVRRCAGAHPRRTDGIERARYAGGA